MRRAIHIADKDPGEVLPYSSLRQGLVDDGSANTRACEWLGCNDLLVRYGSGLRYEDPLRAAVGCCREGIDGTNHVLEDQGSIGGRDLRRRVDIGGHELQSVEGS